MTFARTDIGLNLDMHGIPESDIIKVLFNESPGLVVQMDEIDAKSPRLFL